MRKYPTLLLATTLILAAAAVAAPAALETTTPQEKPAAVSTPAAPSADAIELMREAQVLYRGGKPGEALLKFEDAARAGAAGGEMFYQMGFCYKTVRQDLEKSKEMMKKAIPLLEKVEPSTPMPLYYLAAIQSVELGDSAKGAEVAKKGTDLAEKGAFKKSTDGESLFQIGRLYSLSGQADKAVPWYEKAVAALESDKEANKQYLSFSVDLLAKYYQTKNDFPKASSWYQKLMAMDPGNEQTRMSAGFVMLRAGDYQQAMQSLTGFGDDTLSTESNYITKALQRYIELGTPPAAPEVARMDDAALEDAIGKSAQKLGELRSKEEAATKAANPVADEPKKEIVTLKSGKQVKVVRPRLAPPPDPNFEFKDPDHPTPEEMDQVQRLVFDPPVVPPPPSPERLAADKEFFTLVVQYLRRGHLLRNLAFQKGFSSLMFR